MQTADFSVHSNHVIIFLSRPEIFFVITIKPNILHIHRAKIMKVKCTFIAWNVALNVRHRRGWHYIVVN